MRVKYLLIETAQIVCGSGSMKRRASVRQPVCLSHRSTAAAACGGFAAERPASRRRCSAANASSVTLTADGGG